jgi:soluble lytic murein transglycosylase
MMRSIAILLLLIIPLPALADAMGEIHVQSAFVFAKRKVWSEAIAHAKAANNRILVKYFTWEYLKDPESDAPFDVIVQFMAQNPDWPDKAMLERRAEVALLADNPSDEVLSNWFSAHPPKTYIAKIQQAKTPEELRSYIRSAWVTDDYGKVVEGRLLEKYHAILRPEDHIKRIDRLLWEGKYEDAKRLFKYVPYDYQLLFKARIALAEDKPQAPTDVVNLPHTLKEDPGLIYERLKWRSRSNDREGVRELLLATPFEVPYAEKWWPLRDRQIRQALGDKDIALAEKLLQRHGQKLGTVSYSEAEWLKAWIKLEYRHQPEKAYPQFVALFKTMETPGSKARCAYWAARSAPKADEERWLIQAGKYPATFYGQLALVEMNKNARIAVYSDAEPIGEDKQRFHQRELVQLVYALDKAHETDTASKFIYYLVEKAETPGEAILATRLGREIHRIDFGVRASKKAMQNDILSVESSYPIIAVKNTAGLEKPLLLALMRQESEFYAGAISSSGAFGLMQLLPSTAKEVARKSHISYSSDRLFEADYNITIGSLYLSKMVEKFNGSYVLAIASYNAGPGRVGQWLNNYGPPGNNVHDIVNWIERIPTSETRNYVQHVLGNTEVYRFMLAGQPTKLMLTEDLRR